MILVVANPKGGVGKSTTAAALSVGLRRRGVRILAVDLDPQGSLTSWLGVRPEEAQRRPGMVQLLMDEVAAERAVTDTPAGVPIIAATPTLQVVEEALRARPNREGQVYRALEPIVPTYDVVVVDTPASVGLWLWSALAMMDRLLAPVETEAAAIDGVARLIRELDDVRRYGLNERATLDGVVLTKYDRRRGTDKRAVELIRQGLGDVVMDTVIPTDVRLVEVAETLDVSLWDGESPGAVAYRALTQEVVDRWLSDGMTRA